jgi:SAM-dependent methyltransferase
MRHTLPLAVLLAAASYPVLAGAVGTAPVDAPAPAGHDPSNPPIDCPLHRQGVNAGTLRPFAETEKYIEFLERPDRAAWQKPDDVVAALHLAGDETVADVGAGSGYFTFRFAKALPRGKVIATDIDPEMIRHVHHKVLSKGIGNVEVVLAKSEDPSVDGRADVVFVCDVIHHVEGREAWLRKLASEMKTGARLVVVEFKEGKLPEGPPGSVKIPKAKLVSMLEAAGFSLQSDRTDLLPYQTFLTFTKPAQTKQASK